MVESRLLNPDELKRIAAEMAAHAKAEKAEVPPAAPSDNDTFDEVTEDQIEVLDQKGQLLNDTELWEAAVRLVSQVRIAHPRILQQHLTIDYDKASQLIEQMRRGKIIGFSTRTRPNQVLIAPIEEGGFVPPPPPPEDEEKALYTLITDELLPPEASQAAETPPSQETRPSAEEQEDQKTADELLQSLKEADSAEYGELMHARVSDEEIEDGYRIDTTDKTLVINRKFLRDI